MAKFMSWTQEDDAELTARYGRECNLDLAIRFDRSENSIKQRAVNLGITIWARRADSEFGEAEAREANHHFICAMARAIRAGLERPPMVGINRRACTRRPKFVSHGEAVFPARTSSHFAEG